MQVISFCNFTICFLQSNMQLHLCIKCIFKFSRWISIRSSVYKWNKMCIKMFHTVSCMSFAIFFHFAYLFYILKNKLSIYRKKNGVGWRGHTWEIENGGGGIALYFHMRWVFIPRNSISEKSTRLPQADKLWPVRSNSNFLL